jgi:hypothetical protein
MDQLSKFSAGQEGLNNDISACQELMETKNTGEEAVKSDTSADIDVIRSSKGELSGTIK